MAKPLRKPTEVDLVRIVKEHSETEPIVPSATVRYEFWRRGLISGERSQAREFGLPPPGYNGPSFNKADKKACATGQLERWKRPIGQGSIGWSLPGSSAAQDWAALKGWARDRSFEG